MQQKTNNPTGELLVDTRGLKIQYHVVSAFEKQFTLAKSQPGVIIQNSKVGKDKTYQTKAKSVKGSQSINHQSSVPFFSKIDYRSWIQKEDEEKNPTRAPLDEVKVKKFIEEVAQLLNIHGNWRTFLIDELRSNEFIRKEIGQLAKDNILSMVARVAKEVEEQPSGNREIMAKIVRKFQYSLATITQEERRMELEKVREAQQKMDVKLNFGLEPPAKPKSQVTRAITKQKLIESRKERKSRSKLSQNPKAFHRKVTKIMDRILKWQMNKYNLIVKKFHQPKIHQLDSYIDDSLSVDSIDSIPCKEPEEEHTFLEKVGMRFNFQDVKENQKKPLFSEVTNLLRKQNKIQKASRYYLNKFSFTTERIKRKIQSSLLKTRLKSPHIIGITSNDLSLIPQNEPQ